LGSADIGGTNPRRLTPIRWAVELTIQELGSLGELIAAIATLATLIYLALQIRANTTAVRAESRRGATSHGLHFMGILGENAEAASIFRRGLGDPSELDPDESLRFAFLFSMVVSQSDNIYVDYRLGVVDHGVMESSTDSMLRMIGTPGGRFYWSAYSLSHTPEFREFVSGKLEAPTP
jgi:hypothetical protein